ncbi:MAG: nuclear transport factor 2 family protein [Methylotenera sp.]
MYHIIAKKLVRDSFKRLSADDYVPAFNLMAENCHYPFIGNHALGGQRQNRQLIAQWFQRFLRILPNFQFKPAEIIVNGWPLRTTVTVKLNVSWLRPDGQVYKNIALQMMTLKWGKAVDIITIDDTSAFGALLEVVTQKFAIAEASAQPIGS